MADRAHSAAWLVPALLLVLGGSVSVHGQPLTLDLSVSTRYSDNINKQKNPTREDLEHRVGLRLNKRSDDQGLCRGSLATDLGFSTYQRSTFDNRVSGELDLNSYCQPAQWLRWNLRDTLRDRRTVAADPDTPDNRERRNVLATGPTLTRALSRRTELFTDLEYQATRFERSTGNDSNRYTLSAGAHHQLTPRWRSGVTASHTDVDLFRRDESIRRNNLSLNFSRPGDQSRASGRIGYGWLSNRRGPFASDNNAITGELAYDATLLAGTRFNLQLQRDLSDTSTDFDVAIPGLELDLGESTAVAVTSVSASVSQTIRPASQVALQLSYSESDFISVDTREERFNAILELTHPFRPRLSGGLDLSYRRADFDQGDGLIAHSVRPRVSLDFRQTRHLHWNLGVGLEKRYDEGGVGREYQEHFLSLGLLWNLR
ncbi:MAG: hypothetical protein R3296_12750 [Oleiphilaceae bacterium]|nr:hypothetical protein [Oleiphilaceae bacterium]